MNCLLSVGTKQQRQQRNIGPIFVVLALVPVLEKRNSIKQTLGESMIFTLA
jgi:hypothetical protein